MACEGGHLLRLYVLDDTNLRAMGHRSWVWLGMSGKAHAREVSQHESTTLIFDVVVVVVRNDLVHDSWGLAMVASRWAH